MLIFKPYLRFELLQIIKIININYNDYMKPSLGDISYKIHKIGILLFSSNLKFSTLFNNTLLMFTRKV